MASIQAAITGVAGYVPDYILTNEELSRMVDTTDEWIMTRIGIKERRILKEDPHRARGGGAAHLRYGNPRYAIPRNGQCAGR